MKEKVNDALKQHFRPEFLNRIDDVIVFHELSQGRGHQIVDLMIKRVTEPARGPGPRPRAHRRRPRLLLADRGYDPTLGARPLRRAIQRLVEDPLSERLLWKEFRAGEIIVVDAEPDPDDRREAASRSGRSRASSPRPMELAEAGPTE